MDTAKGLAAAAAGENAKEYTARKKVEAEMDLEAKREAQNQVVISINASFNYKVMI